MVLARVYNDNFNEKTGKGYVFTQKYRGKQITIEPGKYIEMDMEEAEDFKSTYSPILIDANGNHKPEGFKMIRVESINNPIAAPDIKLYRCHVCTFKTPSEDELQAHCDTNHTEQLIDPKVAEARQRIADRLAGKGK